MYLVPLVLIVTSGQRERVGGGGRQLATAVENAPISGSRWRDQDRARAWGLHEQHVSQRRFPPGGKKR